jgi:hypothetical protein
VSSLIDAVRKVSSKKIDEFAKDALGLMPDVIESKIKTYLLKEITNVFTTGAIDLLNSAVATAVAESVDSAGNFDEAQFGRALTSALYDKLASLCQATVKAIPEAVGDQIAELVTG